MIHKAIHKLPGGHDLPIAADSDNLYAARNNIGQNKAPTDLLHCHSGSTNKLAVVCKCRSVVVVVVWCV